MDDLLSLKWNNHRTAFFQVIKGLRNKDLYADVTLACDRKFYPVHRLVLSTCSDYFSAIFERTSCKNPVVILKDIECKELEALLDYMYIGEVNVRQNELASLLKVAESLQIKGLAVPDGDLENLGVSSSHMSKNKNEKRNVSPPPKRRRREEKSVRDSFIKSDDNEQCNSGAQSNDDIHGNTSEPISVQGDIACTPKEDSVNSEIKTEPADNGECENYVNSVGYISGSEGDFESSNPEFSETFKTSFEKEEIVTVPEFESSEFAGPSGLQNSGETSWENSNYSSDTLAESQAAQQQQMFYGYSHAQSVNKKSMGVSCPICRKWISQKSNLPTHLRVHSGERPFSCPFCEYKAAHSSNLRVHVFSRHRDLMKI